ncbi:hypothetical protein A2U01_0088609, partial [Trifolium medium]|nr:hypothetical protein [Trifolium medium]
RFPVVNDLVSVNVDSPADIEDALHQLSEHGDDQGGVELSLGLEGRRKKRQECDADEGDPSSKKFKLGGSETHKFMNVQTGLTS